MESKSTPQSTPRWLSNPELHFEEISNEALKTEYLYNYGVFLLNSQPALSLSLALRGSSQRPFDQNFSKLYNKAESQLNQVISKPSFFTLSKFLSSLSLFLFSIVLLVCAVIFLILKKNRAKSLFGVSVFFLIIASLSLALDQLSYGVLLNSRSLLYSAPDDSSPILPMNRINPPEIMKVVKHIEPDWFLIDPANSPPAWVQSKNLFLISGPLVYKQSEFDSHLPNP